MAKKIEIDIEVNGKMQKATVSAKKLNEALKETGKSARTADRNIKGASEQSANGTKNFSKMAQGMGGLVAVYATLAAQAFAVSAAFEFLKRVGDLRVLRDSQVAYASTTGVALRTLSRDIRRAADGLLTFQEASSAAAIGVASGLNAGQLTKLAEGASAVSKVLGRDVSDSFDRLVRGVTKAEPELLDELGITLRLEDAKRKYAAATGKTVKSLSLLEQKQAVLNEVQSQLNTKFIATTEAIEIQESAIKKVGVAFSDVFNSFSTIIAGPVEKAAGFFADNIKSFIALIGLFVYSIAKNMLPSLDGFIDRAELAATKAGDAVKKAQAEVSSLQNASSPSQVVSGALSGVKAKKGSGIDRLRNQQELTKRQAATLLRYANLEKGVYKDLTMYQRQVYKKALRDILGQKETFWQKSKRGWYSLGNTIEIQAKRARATWTRAMAGIKKVTVGTLDFINKYATKAIVIVAIAQMLLDAANAAGKFLGIIENAPKPLQDLKNELDQNVEKMGSLSEEFSKLGTAVDKHLQAVSKEGGEGVRPTITSLKTLTNAYKTIIPTLIEYTNLARAAQTADYAGVLDGVVTKEGVTLGVDLEIEAAREKAAELAKILGDSFQIPGNGFTFAAKGLNHFIGRLENGLLPLAALAIEDIAKLGKEFEKMNEIVSTFEETFNSTNIAFDSFLAGITKYKTTATDLLNQTLQEIDLLGTRTDLLLSLNQMEIAGLKEIKKSLTERLAVLNLINQAETESQSKVLIAQVKYNQATKLGTSLLNKRAAAQQKIDNNSAEINKRAAELASIESGRIQVSEERKQILLGELGILMQQTEVLKEMEKSSLRTAQAGLQGLETGLQSNIKQILTGEEASLKKALAKVAKSVAESIADELANQATESLMKGVRSFLGIKEAKTPEQKMEEAMNSAADLTAEKWRLAITEAGVELARRIREQETVPVSAERTGSGGELDTEGTPGQAIRDTISKLYSVPLPVEDTIPTDGKKKEQTELPVMSRIESILAKLDKLYVDALPVTIVSGTGTGTGTSTNKSTMNTNTKAVYGVTDSLHSTENTIDATMGSDGEFQTGVGKIMKEHGESIQTASNMMLHAMAGGTSTGAMLLNTGLSAVIGHFAPGSGTGKETTARYGGVVSNGRKMSGYSAGGVARGPQGGYPATLHGTEAIVPLPNKKSIPVDLQGSMGQQNNVVVNVSMDSTGASTDAQGNAEDSKRLGTLIAGAVQKELHNQKRAGGILNPLGAS